MIKIDLFGSTGSIGQNTLQVVKEHPDLFKIVTLTAFQNAELLAQQAIEFKPESVGIFNSSKAGMLRSSLSGFGMKIFGGQEDLVRLAGDSPADLMVNSIVGSAGLLPTLSAIRSGKNIGLANKETLVAAGEIVTDLVREKNVMLIPIDSEHSAIFQCLRGEQPDHIRRIILTASGGPFRGYNCEQLRSVTVEQALKHPNWSMGSKITIDSATLMNKGLEVIEARWLFGIPAERIDVVLHPQSVIHSMIEMIDGSVKAQAGLPDMKYPIQYALSFPGRLPNTFPSVSWADLRLDFSIPDRKTFRCLDLAYEALRAGGTMPAVMNAANESAVQLFLKRTIGFLDIAERIEKTMMSHNPVNSPAIGDILDADRWARDYALQNV